MDQEINKKLTFFEAKKRRKKKEKKINDSEKILIIITWPFLVAVNASGILLIVVNNKVTYKSATAFVKTLGV